MSEALREFFPACKKEVEYEIDLELGGKKFCPICGRTKEMAEKGFKAEQLIKKRKDREKFSSALYRYINPMDILGIARGQPTLITILLL